MPPTTRRTPAEIASDNARQAANLVAKAKSRVAKAEEEVTKAKPAVARAERNLRFLLTHPDLPEAVRVELAPDDGQEEIPVPEESTSSIAAQRDGADA